MCLSVLKLVPSESAAKRVQFQIDDTKSWPLWLTFSRQRRIWSFHVVVLQRIPKKCTKNYNARAQPLFCSLNLLFRDVAVAVVFCVRSLYRSFSRDVITF